MKKSITKFSVKNALLIFPLLFFCGGFSEGNNHCGTFLVLSNGGEQKKIIVQILDEHNKPTAAKIRVTEQDSIYYAPEGHLVDFLLDSSGGDAMLGNDRRFAYVEGEFRINLPEANLKFEVVKGYAYRFFDSTFHISAQTDTIRIQLQKWFEFREGKWYSGDVHVHHIDPETALLEMKAEDLNVCNILTSDFTDDNDRFRGVPEPISDASHIIYVNQEYREDRLGHIDLLNLKKLIEPVKPIRQYQYPLNIKACDETHAQGGHVSWAHFAAWPGLEGPLAIVLKKVDAVELLCSIDPFSDPIFVSDVVPDLRMNPGLKLWYRLLNCGLKIPATAGTDKMTKWVTVGANRVYANLNGDFNYQNWIDALNRGNSFITNSPFLFCRADNKNPGEEIKISGRKTVTINAEMWSQLPVDRIEIIANGVVIAEKIIEEGQYYAKLETEYKPVKSGWIAARVHQFDQEDAIRGVSFSRRREAGGGLTLFNRYFGTMRPETPFAHTSPIYIMVDGQPTRSKEDAEYYIRYLENSMSWLQKLGHFPSEQAKQEVLGAFKRGKIEFMKLAK
ncbi:MAG: CehA/McbA family metallohydrolase [Ferruginibacter sp.]